MVVLAGLAVGGRIGARVAFAGAAVGTTIAMGVVGATTGAREIGAVGPATGVGAIIGAVGISKYGGKVRFTGCVACRDSFGMVGAAEGTFCFGAALEVPLSFPVAPNTSVVVGSCVATLVSLFAFLVGARVGAGDG
jgi:hypothetical protein